MKNYRCDPLFLHIKLFVKFYFALLLITYVPSYLYVMKVAKHETFAPPIGFLISLLPTLPIFVVCGFRYGIFRAEEREGEKYLREKELREQEKSMVTSGEV
jgi:hypothetical protein